MAGMIGNNSEEMSELVSKLSQAVDQITQAMTSLDGKAQSVNWVGPDATRFKGTQWPASKQQLARVIADLNDVKALVAKQRQQQIDASV